MRKLIYLFFLLFLLPSCQTDNPNIVQEYPKDQYLEKKQRAGNMFGNREGIVIYEDTGDGEQEKMTLWRKSVGVVSGLMPISIADEKSGLVSTDWGNIGGISDNSDLYKINVIVSGKEIKKENLKVSAFKKSSDGKNVNDPNVEAKIIDMILANKSR